MKQHINLLKKQFRSERTCTPTCLKINGRRTYDRESWLQGALDFGKSRFTDPSNDMSAQLDRLEKLYSANENNNLDVFPSSPLEFFDTLQSRAEMKIGTAGGGDGNTRDIYKDLPLLAVAHWHSLFDRRCKFGRDAPCPISWIFNFIGLPKSKMVEEFYDLRWICKSLVLQKYLRMSNCTYVEHIYIYIC